MSLKSNALSIASQAARRASLLVLSRIRLGSLSIVDRSLVPPQTFHFPSPPTGGKAGDDCGKERDLAEAKLVVVKETFWLRLAAMGDLGFAEAYMFGDVLCTPDDLLALFRVFLRNRPYLTTIDSSLVGSLLSIPSKLISLIPSPITSSFSFVQSTLGLNWNLDSLQTSRSNIAAHYDLSNAMFEAFLSPDMTYSCAIFDALDEDLSLPSLKKMSSQATSAGEVDSDHSKRHSNGLPTPIGTPEPHTKDEVSSASCTSSLEFPSQPSDMQATRIKLGKEDGRDAALHAAQLRKLEHIVRQLRIPPSSCKPIHILEIGTGWGSLSILLATRFPHIEIDTLTLSALQASHVRSLLNSSDPSLTLSRRIRVHEISYAALKDQFPEWKGRFDRVVSVEMVEAVGRAKGALEGYWRTIDWALKETEGLGVVMGITIPEGRYERYLQETDFIQKWIFPGGHLPSLTHLLSSLTVGSQGRLTVDSVSNIGPHYARTLREWRRRFCHVFGSDFECLPSGSQFSFSNKVNEFEVRKEKNDRLRAALLEGRPTGEKRAEEELDDESVEVFRRKWIYYFVYCEIGFSTRSLGDHIITFTREANEGFGCDAFRYGN